MDLFTVSKPLAAIEGIVVIYYPPGSTNCLGVVRNNREIAKELLQSIGTGSRVALPIPWDLKVINGPEDQIVIERPQG